MFARDLEQLVGAVHNLGEKNPKDTCVHHTKQVPVLKKTAFKGKDFHSCLEFLQLQLSNRYKEQQ